MLHIYGNTTKVVVNPPQVILSAGRRNLQFFQSRCIPRLISVTGVVLVPLSDYGRWYFIHRRKERPEEKSGNVFVPFSCIHNIPEVTLV
jgi:hypothetical protein